MPSAQPKIGRPSTYTDQIADDICTRLAAGDSLRSVCITLDIPMSKVMRWLQMYPTFQEQYRHAREDQVEAYVDEMVEIADNQSEDAKSRQVRINARIWAASKIKPKKYGDVPAVLVDNRQQLMVVMPTTGEATKARLLQAPAIEAEIVEPEE